MFSEAIVQANGRLVSGGRQRHSVRVFGSPIHKGVIKMGPNHAQIIRVYTREVGSPIADFVLDATKPAEVVVEVEAGATVFSLGAKFTTGFMVKDLETGASIGYTPPAVSGTLSSPPWTSPSEAFVYTISPAALAPHKGHLCRVYAYLLVGVAQYDASFVESELFLIEP